MRAWNPLRWVFAPPFCGLRGEFHEQHWLFGEVVTAFFAVASYGLELRTRTKKRAETHWKYLSHFFVDQPPRFTLHMCCPWVGVCWGVLEVWRSTGFHHRSYTCNCRRIVFIPPATTKPYNSFFTGKISSMSCPEVWPQRHLEVQLFITVKLMHALGILRCFLTLPWISAVLMRFSSHISSPAALVVWSLLSTVIGILRCMDIDFRPKCWKTLHEIATVVAWNSSADILRMPLDTFPQNLLKGVTHVAPSWVPSGFDIRTCLHSLSCTCLTAWVYDASKSVW